jgi:phytoene synthase
VAGTVGVMKCPLLGLQSEIAQRHAADLGLAMQLTNICRDVGEDARRGRVYLPRAAPQRGRAEQVLDGASMHRRDVIAGLLARADALYEAETGLSFLPARARLAVLIASRLYAIGVSLATARRSARAPS